MCKYLTGSKTTGYMCKLTKKKCRYQTYCTQSHQYTLNDTKTCPASK